MKKIGSLGHMITGVDIIATGICPSGLLFRILHMPNILNDHAIHSVTYVLARRGGIQGAVAGSLTNLLYECSQHGGYIPGDGDIRDAWVGTGSALVGLFMHHIVSRRK